MTVVTSMKGTVPAPPGVPVVTWALDGVPSDKGGESIRKGPSNTNAASRRGLIWMTAFVLGTALFVLIIGVTRFTTFLGSDTQTETLNLCSGEDCGDGMCLRPCKGSVRRFIFCECSSSCACPSEGPVWTHPKQTIYCTVFCSATDGLIRTLPCASILHSIPAACFSHDQAHK